jgi:F0F1-type ATP synthase assembly protein I
MAENAGLALVNFFTRYAIVCMPDDSDFLARSFRYLQENIRRSGPAAAASYTLIGAIVLLGGIGYAVDAWRGTSRFLLGGLLLGLVVGFYELAKTVWGQGKG